MSSAEGEEQSNLEEDEVDASSSESEDDETDASSSESEFDEEFEEEFERTCERIAANDPALTRVDFDYLNIGDERAGRLVAALQVNTVVRYLHLCHTGISEALVIAVVGALENSNTLLELNLDGNNIGLEGARALAGFLRNSTSLNDLCLNDCGIGVEDVRLLAGGITSNSSLAYLGLGGNNFGDEGASVLAGVLPGNSTLTQLYLDDNEIGDAGVIALLEALSSNTSLAELYLLLNSITDVGARLLAKALLVKSSFTTLSLWGDDNSEALTRLVDELTEINADAPNPQEALERKIAWLRNLDEGDLSLLGFEESGVEEEVRRLEVVCRVGWLISSGLNGDKGDAVTLVLDQLQHFMQAEQRRGLFKQLLGSPQDGKDVAESVNETTAITLYRHAVECGAAPGVLMNLLRAHAESLCECQDAKHGLYPFMLLATMVEAGVGDVMEALQMNPTLVKIGIPHVPGDDCAGNGTKNEDLQSRHDALLVSHKMLQGELEALQKKYEALLVSRSE